MKTKIRQRMIAMALAGMMIASPVGGSVFAADEAIAEQAQPVAAAEVKEEVKEEAKAEVKEEAKVEIKEETKEIKAETPEQKKEEAAEVKAVEASASQEVKTTEDAKIELAAPEAEVQKEEKAEAAAEEQAVAEEDDLSDVVCGDEVSTQLTVHVTNILWNRYVNGKAVPYESTYKLVNGQTKAASAYTNLAGGTKTTVKVSTEEGTYTFLKVCALASSNSGIKTANDAGSVRAIKKIGFNKGVATVTFEDGSTKKYINASDIYVSPVYSVEYIKRLSFNYIDNISTGTGSWGGTLESYSHTFKRPDDQAHYSFINWENKKTGETYNPGEKITFSKADYTERNNDESAYAVWQPSVTVRYHYNGNTVETENFDSINVYDKSAEIDGVEYNAWYDEAGNILADGAAFEAPAPVTEKVDRTIYNVYARRPVTIKAASAEWTFDGQAHSDDSVSVTAGGLFEGDEIVAEVSGSITAAGEAANAIESVKIMRNGADVSEYYDITTENGLLSVKAAPAPAAKTDNGTPAAPATKEDKGTPAAPKNRPAAPAARTADNQAAAEIVEQGTPMAAPEAFIADSDAPLAANNTWALLNLIMTVITGIISAVLLTGYFGKKEDEEDENEDAETKRKGLVRLASLIPAAGAIIAFILTEDMTNMMAFTDRWTILMAVILLIQAVTAILAKKEKEEPEETAETAETI